MRTLYIGIWSVLTACTSLVTAQLPSSDIYKFTIEEESGTTILSNPVYLTNFHDGYNNQPSFIDDNELYFTSNMGDDSAQTDIYSLNLKNKELLRITDTKQSEYSPKLMPNGNTFSVVRVELEEKTKQVLWKYPIDRSNTGELSVYDKKNIGYYEWLGVSKIAFFMVGDPHKLVIYDNVRGGYKAIASDIGRSLVEYRGKLYFIQKSPSSWFIKEYNPVTQGISIVCSTAAKTEDFAITKEGEIWMTNGSEILKRSLIERQNWQKVTDTSPWNLNNLSRIEIRNNQLIVVNTNE